MPGKKKSGAKNKKRKNELMRRGTESEKMLEKKIMAMVRNSKRGALQKDITRALKIDGKKCSAVLKQMEDKGLIKRAPESAGGVRAFRISIVQKQDYTPLLAKGTIAPCIGCTSECVPENCEHIGEWIRNLVRRDLESRTN